MDIDIDKIILDNLEIKEKLDMYQKNYENNFIKYFINEDDNLNKNYLEIINIKDDVEKIINNGYSDVNNLNIYKNLLDQCSNLRTIIKSYNNNINNIIPKINEKISLYENFSLNHPKKILEDIPDAIGKAISKVFSKVTDVFNMILKFFKWVYGQISDYFPLIKKIFNKIFNFIKKTILFIKNKIIPMIIKIFKLIPYLFKTILTTFTNIKKTKLLFPILFLLLLFGVQIYLRYLTGLQAPIPSVIIIIISLLLSLFIITYHGDTMYNIEKNFLKYIIILFDNDTIKKKYNLSSKFGINNYDSSINELTNILFNNPITTIIVCLITLVLFKILLKIFGKTLYNNLISNLHKI